METNKTQGGYAVGVTRQGEKKVFDVIEDILDCSSQDLRSLDFSNAKGVKILRCNSNHIEKLHLDGLTNLVELYCYCNKLILLDCRELIKLKALNCINNNIQTLTIRGLENIQILECHNNPLPPCNQEGKDWIIKRAKIKLQVKDGLCGCLYESILDYNKSHDCCISNKVTDTFPKLPFEDATIIFNEKWRAFDYWRHINNIPVRANFLDFINS